MIACVDLGVSRIQEIVLKYGKETFRNTCEDLMDYAERRMRAELSSFKDGKYGFSDIVENDGIAVACVAGRPVIPTAPGELAVPTLPGALTLATPKPWKRAGQA